MRIAVFSMAAVFLLGVHPSIWAVEIPDKEFRLCGGIASVSERVNCYDNLQKKYGGTPADLSAPKTGWTFSRSKSPIDDTETIILTRKADSLINGWPDKSIRPILVMRCQEGKTEVYVNTGMAALVESGSGVTITVRFDKEE